MLCAEDFQIIKKIVSETVTPIMAIEGQRIQTELEGSIQHEFRETHMMLNTLDEHLEKIESQMDKIKIQLENFDDRLQTVEIRLNKLEQRTTKIHKKLEQVNKNGESMIWYFDKRYTTLHTRVDRVEHKLNIYDSKPDFMKIYDAYDKLAENES